MKKAWNLGIVEESYIVRAGLTRIFARTAFRQCIECASMEQLWKSLSDEIEIDAFLIDIGLDVVPFEGDIEALQSRFPAAHIVLMADTDGDDQVAEAMQIGAHGFIVKAMRVEAIVKSLELILLGQPVFPARSFGKKRHPAAGQILPPPNGHMHHLNGMASHLSTREIEVLLSLREGKSNKEIARDLDISDATVKVHVKAILRKLRMKNRTEAALWATGARLLQPVSQEH